MEALSSSQPLNAEQAVLQNLLTDTDSDVETESIAKQGARTLADTYGAAQLVETITLRVVSACSGEHRFGPLQVCPTDRVEWR